MAESLAQRTTSCASTPPYLLLARRSVPATAYGKDSHFSSKLKVILCELILVIYVRMEWETAVPKADPTPVYFYPQYVFQEHVQWKENDKPLLQEDTQKRSLLSRRTPMVRGDRPVKGMSCRDGEGDLASFMMMTKGSGTRKVDGGDKNKGGDKKKEDRPRRQKQHLQEAVTAAAQGCQAETGGKTGHVSQGQPQPLAAGCSGQRNTGHFYQKNRKGEEHRPERARTQAP